MRVEDLLLSYFNRPYVPKFILVACLLFTLVSKSYAQDTMLSQQLQQYVGFLASDSLKGRFAGTPEGFKAANFIAKEMHNTGLKPAAGFEGFFAPFVYKKKKLQNVVGAIAGTSLKDEVVIFCAHYDHVGTKSTNPFPYLQSSNRKDTIYNGANDNASGVAALLALANLIKRDTVQPLRTIFFIAFDGEEIGEIGSFYLSDFFIPDKVVAVINLEMLGIPDTRGPFITATQLSNLRIVLNNTLAQADPTLYGKQFFKEDNQLEQNLWKRSDNYPFLLHKMAAHTITATYTDNPFYHAVKDEPKTLDYAFMAKLVTAIKIATSSLYLTNVKLKLKF